MSSVIQEWINELPWKMQTVLILGGRGVDGVSKENPSKAYSRYLRSVIFQDADKTTGFMRDCSPSVPFQVFLDYAEGLPVHYITHFAHACAIVGYYHPDTTISSAFLQIYRSICGLMHMNPEHMGQLWERLGGNTKNGLLT